MHLADVAVDYRIYAYLIRSENNKDQEQTNKPRKDNWIIDFLDIETKSDSS